MLYKRLYDNYMVTKYIGANHSINSKFSWKPILKQHTFSFFFYIYNTYTCILKVSPE